MSSFRNDTDDTTDPLGELLAQAAPSVPSSDPAVIAAASDLAHSSARRGRRSPLRRPFVITAISLGLVFTGATASFALPAILEWAPWQPDLTVVRHFPIDGSDDTEKCVLTVAVTTARPDTDQSRAARQYLATMDLSDFTPTLDDLPPGRREFELSHGASEAQLLAFALSREVTRRMTEAGYFKEGLSLSGRVACGDELSDE